MDNQEILKKALAIVSENIDLQISLQTELRNLLYHLKDLTEYEEKGLKDVLNKGSLYDIEKYLQSLIKW